MDSETYWQRRMEELEQHWHDKGRQTIEKELQALYEDALDAIYRMKSLPSMAALRRIMS